MVVSLRSLHERRQDGRARRRVDDRGPVHIIVDYTDDDGWPDGSLVLGVAWDVSEHVVRSAANLAAGLDLHLVCAFVDPASYLVEWSPVGSQVAASLDPESNEEAQFPSSDLLRKLEAILGPPGEAWSFRVLNGDVTLALDRLAKSTGASLLVVGGPWPGLAARIDRLLEGSVSAHLARTQSRPVLVIPG